MSKSEAGKSDAEFYIVIEAARDSKMAEATAGFAKTFTVEAKIAEQILKSSPIVFLSRLTKQDIRVLKPKLVDLSSAGIEFRITTKPADRIPKVNWPIKPQFGTGEGGQLITTVSFIWDNNAFVCPSCGESFVFRRVGKPRAATPAEATAASAPASAPAPAPAPARPAAPAPAARPAPAIAARPPAPAAKPAPAPAAARAPAAAAARPPARKEEDLGTVDLLDEVPSLDLDDVAPLEEVPEINEEAPPLDDIEVLPVDEVEEVKPAAKKPVGPPPKGPVRPGGMIKPGAPPQDEGDEDELCSVFLNRITSAKDQEVAAKIIAEVRSCPIKEAKELAARMVIPVVKDVPKSEAEVILSKFQKAKIPGRITKKK
ncbi:MAG: hypothetical protein HYY18_10065 [Planctomycetes bacterium]|nr:hypothetical protein [Planctomycetota bacterium]